MSNANLSLGLVIVNNGNEILLIKERDKKIWHLFWCEIKIGESFKDAIKKSMRRFFSVVGAEIGGVVYLGVSISQRELLMVGGENSASILVRVIMQRPKKITTPKGIEAKWFSIKGLSRQKNVESWLREELDLVGRIVGKTQANLLKVADLDPESFTITENLLRQMK